MASFSYFIPLLLEAEGGYQSMSNDSGNYNSLGQLVGTNFGIAAKTYEVWIKRPPSVTDMKNMLKNTALDIYKFWYWNKLKADSINSQSVANIIVDHAVNAGPQSAGIMIQRILNQKFHKNLAQDGIIGNITIQAINSVNSQVLFDEIKKARHSYYYSIGGAFLDGWISRLNKFSFSEKKKASQ
ncbi:hypothetical protein FLJC2902T_17540 [Flavobacterium limnosediminis JC2902]|uniref:Uncharacterized protein n=1 Tax=Flavobacterium limnosediminis JC2902 TaxID=1341181 RepID=V6SP47_9FLAO|nr:glycosyl hydrolase 108 family protein [Flavobacterium limnosediminis]ESU28396.1 hypothetical protein FLJC2902T_17540 [Flavobacterium limnosediminis JC2902]